MIHDTGHKEYNYWKQQKPKIIKLFCFFPFESSDLRTRLKLHYVHKNTTFYIIYNNKYNKYNI